MYPPIGIFDPNVDVYKDDSKDNRENIKHVSNNPQIPLWNNAAS
jgi:hypothetical protein